LPWYETSDIRVILSDFHRELLQEELSETGTTINREFLIFTESFGDAGFRFFYLDGNFENPIVYDYDYVDERGLKAEITTEDKTFSQVVDEYVDSKLKIDQTGIIP